MELLKYKVAVALLCSALFGCFVHQWNQPKSVTEIAARAIPSVVYLRSGCSGFVASKYGHILTAAHCISPRERTKELVFWQHRKVYRALVLSTTPWLDVAVLQVPNMPEDVPVLEIDSSLEYSAGTSVIDIGHPLGVFPWTVTSGIVSREFSSGGISFVQFSAAIAPGCSGGPVINSQGKVVAIAQRINNYAKYIGFGVPGRTLKAMLCGVYNGCYL